MRVLLTSLLVSMFCACGPATVEETPPAGVARKAELAQLYSQKLHSAARLASKGTGWLATGVCDSMLWTGLAAASKGIHPVSLAASEYPAEPGRFNRRPAPFCGPGAGSKTTWSRDMAMGLLIGAWKTKQLSLLERHAEYGVQNLWKMGEPLADGRVLYTPAMIGMLYQTIYALGGSDNDNRRWPAAYPSGLVDYQAHLQALGIWLRGAITPTEFNAISSKMLARIDEHASRQPACPLYAHLKGLYNGDMGTTVDLLLGRWACDYQRGDKEADLAEWLFVASETLRKIP